MGILFRFLHCVTVKNSHVLKEWTVTIFKVTEFVQMDADVIQRKKYGSDITQIVVASPVNSTKDGNRGQDCPKRMGV